MKLKNTTDWPDHFLRRMVAWCCRQIAMPVRRVSSAQFRNRTNRSYSGHAYSRRIVCSVGPDSRFPLKPDSRDGMAGEVIADRTEALVAVTAHELEHVSQFHSGRDYKLKGRCEASTRAVEVRVLRAFRANRESLLAEWSAPPANREKPKASIQDKRAAKAQADLERWQRKLKLAQTKCRKLKQRVAYYDKALAAARPQ